MVKKVSKDKCYNEVHKLPYNEVGLVLGTSKYNRNGSTNLYFKYRVQATLRLFHANKIKYVLISGDNGSKKYNEPEDFKNALIQGGVPSNRIYQDFAGFRTLDSMIRAIKVFQLKKFTIISQEFHNTRAIFLARMNGAHCIAYNAQDVTMKKVGLKTHLREYFAKTKAVIDVLTLKEPKFLGPKIDINS